MAGKANRKVAPGRTPFATAKSPKASKPGTPPATRGFPGVKSPTRKASSKTGKPRAMPSPPKGTVLTPNA